MRTSRILFFCHTRWFNAVANYALEAAAALKDAGVEVFFSVRHGSPLAEKAAHLAFPVISSRYAVLTPILVARCIARSDIRAAVVFTSNGSLGLALLRQLYRNLTVLRFRGDASSPRGGLLPSLLYSQAAIDGMIFPSAYARKLCANVLSATVPNTVLPYPYRFSGHPNPAGVSRDRTNQAHPAVFCLLGRNQTVKGHVELVRAFAKAALPDARLVLLIKNLNEFPEELQNLKRLIGDLGLTERISLTGFVQDLDTVMAGIDCGVVPSLGSEAICRVAVEFFARRIPVIAFPVGALPESVQTRKNGLLCSEVSVSALSCALQDFVRMSPSERLTLQLEAEQTYRNGHTPEAFAAGFLAFCNRPGRRSDTA